MISDSSFLKKCVQYVSMQHIMKIFTGVLYVILYLWSLFHVSKAIDVKQDLAPQEYNIFKDNLAISFGLIKIDIPANTVTNYTGGIPEWDHSQLIRHSAPSTAHVISI